MILKFWNRVKPNVVVAQDGSGNYRKINDAIANMPVKAGRYVIYIKAGVYHEYILVPKHKDNLFMYGDGPLRTIITGQHSNNSGQKTDASATFGKLHSLCQFTCGLDYVETGMIILFCIFVRPKDMYRLFFSL